MKILNRLRDILNYTIDYFSHFNRANSLSLVLAIVLASVFSLLIIMSASYVYNSITSYGTDFVDLIGENGGLYFWVGRKAPLIAVVNIMTLALLAPHFVQFSKQPNVSPRLITHLKSISSKKWALYLGFLATMYLFELIPDPFTYDPFGFDDLFYQYDSNSKWRFWVYEFTRYIAYGLAIVFSYVLIHRDKISIKFIVDNRITIFTVFLLLLSIEAITNAAIAGTNSHVGNLISYLFDSDFLFQATLTLINLTIILLFVPAKIISMTFTESHENELQDSVPKNEDDLLDSELTDD